MDPIPLAKGSLKGSFRTGFTIIEITLFFAISAFLIVGLIISTGATIARQRYTDSVQDFTEFLRRQYSEVINAENGRVGKETCNSKQEDFQGRTGCLIYGRLILFGGDGDEVNTYTVVGKDLGTSAIAYTDTLEALAAAHLFIPPTASTSQYTLQWDAKAEAENGRPKEVSILIIRAPQNGVIHTFVLDGDMLDAEDYPSLDDEPIILLNSLGKGVQPDFKVAGVKFYVGSDDVLASAGTRREVCIHSGGRNSTAIELFAQDNAEENICD